MKLIRSFGIAMSMYTKIPMPMVEWSEENMKYAMCFFPVAGVIIGFLEYVTGYVLLHLSCGSLLFAAAMTLLPILVSGGIHLDGFMDTADALASYGDREKKLAILKDSHCGAFAVIGLVMYAIWSLAVWSEIAGMDTKVLRMICFGFVISRTLSGFSVVTFRAARNSGLVRTFQDQAQKKAVRVTMVCMFIVVSGVMLYTDWKTALCILGCAMTVFWHYHHTSYRQFGGVTGDLAGYFLQMCELFMLTGGYAAVRIFG